MPPNSQKAIERLTETRNAVESLVNFSSSDGQFTKWQRDTRVALERIFGRQSPNVAEFEHISYWPNIIGGGTPEEATQAYRNGLYEASNLLASMISEVEEWGLGETGTMESASVTRDNRETNIRLLLARFHRIARTLRDRYNGRPTLEIDDEYDVQDLLHALLKLHFDDIRPEEWTPSYAGGSARMDFLLKEIQTVVEVKKTRKGLESKQVGEQLIVDIEKYQEHPECKRLICFVYDPEGRIGNPAGLESDLNNRERAVHVLVVVEPKV